MARKQHIDYAREFQHLGYSFAMNDMDDSIECNGERLSEGLAAEIESRMIDSGFPASGIGRAWTYEAHKARYHPLIEYFNGLSWNGQDIFNQFMAAFDFDDPCFAKIINWRFMHGVVGKVLNQDQNFMMVINGRQGVGKSTLSRWICPTQKYFVEGTLNPEHNDTKLRIISNLLWEVGELQYTTRKADVDALKNVITLQEVKVRPPYHRHDIAKKVSCSFIGTINENGAGFLNDPTGSRRFAVVKVNEIDWQHYTRLDKEQLWAQITATYKGGERGYLLPDEQQKQHEINAGYTLISSTHELLMKFYEIDPAKYPLDWMPAADILMELHHQGMTGSQRAAQMEIAAIMETLGIEKSNASGTTGYGRQICYRGIRRKI